MEEHKDFISSSQNTQQQVESMKRTMAKSGVDVFENITAKNDLYEHLRYRLKVSFFIY